MRQRLPGRELDNRRVGEVGSEVVAKLFGFSARGSDGGEAAGFGGSFREETGHERSAHAVDEGEIGASLSARERIREAFRATKNGDKRLNTHPESLRRPRV